MNDDLMVWLQQWYLENCNDDWEHSYGIDIGNIDNPGWMISIDLAETTLENLSFSPVEIKRTETDWIYCKKEKLKFKAYCGALNLLEAIAIFRSWVVSS